MHGSAHLLRGTVLALAILAPLAGVARADDVGPVAAGKNIAQTWCINCHVIAPNQARGSDQVPSFAAIAARTTTTSDSLHAFLAQPHGKMPDFKLTPTDIDNMASYILSLRR